MAHYCPNCSAELKPPVADCWNCGALFGPASSWTPTDKPLGVFKQRERGTILPKQEALLGGGMNPRKRTVGALAFGFLLFVPTFGIGAFVALILGAWLGALLALAIGWGFWTALFYIFMPTIDKWMKKVLGTSDAA